MSKPPFRNVPPPPGSKPASAYARFIPREELHEFEAWNPGSLTGEAERARPGAAAAAQAPAEADAPAQAAAARQAGYQDGYRDGLVALESFKQSHAAQMAAQLGQLVDSLNAQFDELEAQLAQAVAGTAMQLARQIVRHELATDPALVARVAAEAIGAVLPSARRITLRVNPQDLAFVADGAAEAVAAREGRLLPDDSIARGGCRVESDLGAVDARIESRWTQAVAALGDPQPWADPAGGGAP